MPLSTEIPSTQGVRAIDRDSCGVGLGSGF